MLKSLNKENYNSILNGILSKIPSFNLKSLVNNLYYGKLPSYFRNYLEPEFDYLEEVAEEINPYLNTLRKNLIGQIQEDPKKALKSSLESLLFPSQKYKEKFCEKIKESVEEVSYVAEIGAVEGYKIWEVKFNLPFIGKIAKSKLKEEIGKEDLPCFDYVKKEISRVKEEIYDFFDYLGFSSDKTFSHEYIRNKYHNKMNKLNHPERRLLEYDYNSGFHIPLNAKESENLFNKKIKEDYNLQDEIKDFNYYTFKRKEEREKEFIQSDYNSIWEKLICYISEFFKWLFI